jgi:tRNA dimethylallyltransferase
MNHDAVLIAGPTASGKSQIALSIAEALGAEIVNADAMQIYRELRVLTARPSDEDMARVPHRLYGHVSVREPYSVGHYQADAARVFEETRKNSRATIFVGGSGLYFSALTNGIADIPPIPESVRAAVRAKFGNAAGLAIHSELAERDPDMAKNLRASDRQRMIRALEVLEGTGRSLSFWQKGPATPVLRDMSVKRFVLDVPRDILRERIESRFRAMIHSGAIEEAGALATLDPSLPAAKILGLRELIALRGGQMSEEDAIARAVTRTGQYVKRQVTWARHQMADWPRIGPGDPDKIIAEILTQVA